MDRHSHWQGVYAAGMETEFGWFQECPAPSLRLIESSGLPLEARILDVGGGASRLVDHLLARGYRHVTVLDIAETSLVTARTRLGSRAASVDWILADITEWEPPCRYDLWHDRAAFHFLVDARDREAYAAVMSAAVPLGGQAIIGTFALDGPDRCSGLPVQRYDAARLAAHFPEFQVSESLEETHVTPTGKRQRFHFSRLTRL